MFVLLRNGLGPFGKSIGITVPQFWTSLSGSWEGNTEAQDKTIAGAVCLFDPSTILAASCLNILFQRGGGTSHVPAGCCEDQPVYLFVPTSPKMLRPVKA